MPSVRCEFFNDLLWTYVAEIAKRRKVTRCDALESIVKEHMKFMAKMEKEMGGIRGKKKRKR